MLSLSKFFDSHHHYSLADRHQGPGASQIDEATKKIKRVIPKQRCSLAGSCYSSKLASVFCCCRYKTLTCETHLCCSLLSLFFTYPVEEEAGCGPSGNKHDFMLEVDGDGICCTKCAWQILAKNAVLSAEACLKMCGPGTILVARCFSEPWFCSHRAVEPPVHAGEAECLLPSLCRLSPFRAGNRGWSSVQRQRHTPVQRWCTQAAKSQAQVALFRQLMHLLWLQQVQQRHSGASAAAVRGAPCAHISRPVRLARRPGSGYRPQGCAGATLLTKPF